MNYFRPGLEESITLPPHPKDSDEMGEVVSAVASRTELTKLLKEKKN